MVSTILPNPNARGPSKAGLRTSTSPATRIAITAPLIRIPPTSRFNARGWSRARRAKAKVVAVDEARPPAAAVTTIPNVPPKIRTAT